MRHSGLSGRLFAASLVVLAAADGEAALASRDRQKPAGLPTGVTTSISITMQPIKSLGGIDPGLNVRLTRAFTRYLASNCCSNISIRPQLDAAAQHVSLNSAGLKYTVSSDLSCSAATGTSSGRYLCTMRMFRERSDKDREHGPKMGIWRA